MTVSEGINITITHDPAALLQPLLHYLQMQQIRGDTVCHMWFLERARTG